MDLQFINFPVNKSLLAEDGGKEQRRIGPSDEYRRSSA
jgi:hypothetical protein